MGNSLETRERLEAEKDSHFILSMGQGVRHAGGPQRVGVARLAHMATPHSVRAVLIAEPLCIALFGERRRAETVEYNHDVSLVRLGRLPRCRDSAVDSCEESAASFFRGRSAILLST
jgi:hypothetical protein